MPRQQLQENSGLVDNDFCNFEFYNHPVKPTKNPRRDLMEFLEERKKRPISNIKLPELRGLVKLVRPNAIDYVPPKQSNSLRFKKKRYYPDLVKPSKDPTDLDLMLKNIR